ncbi:MAG: apolipoprotein N-acyltransferase [Candidatus Symbiobacter sp.]|nr:apolipoprotein N-acyltransferase [Candidatus Symbiobacter sp.]
MVNISWVKTSWAKIANLARLGKIWHEAPPIKGGKRLAVMIAWGAAASLSLPPFGLVPFLPLALVGLLWQLRYASSRRAAFVMGWGFGFGFFLAGLYWIANAVLIDFARFWWIYPLALVGLPLFLALYIGLVTVMWYGLAARRHRNAMADQASPRALPLDLTNLIWFALLWAGAEYARGHLFTGLPWNLVAYAWQDALAMQQAAAWVGAYGVSLLTLLILVLPAGWYQPKGKMVCFIGAMALSVWAILGAWRLYGSAVPPREPPVRMRLVQPNIPQRLKLDPQFDAATVEHLLALSKIPSQAPLAAIIWPEAATNFVLEREADWRRHISAALPRGTVLITGTIRLLPRDSNRDSNTDSNRDSSTDSNRDSNTDSNRDSNTYSNRDSNTYSNRDSSTDSSPSQDPILTNGLVVLSSDNQILAAYDKAHLVPFGEYMPWRDWLPMPPAIANMVDFTPGPGPQSLRIPGVPSFSPLICYEAIFPGQVMPQNINPPPNGSDRPQFLLSLANDGWYGYSTGPVQHFSQTLWRGIEEGVPVVRADNYGISGVSDAFGRIEQHLGLDQSGILDVTLPPALPHPTLYAKYGDGLWLWAAAFILMGTLSRVRRQTIVGSHSNQ